MQWRIGVFGVIGVVILITTIRNMTLLGGMAGGIAAGVALAWLGLRHTKFESGPDGNFYTPHAYIGLLVSTLLVGRLAYRFVVMGPALQQVAPPDTSPFAAYQSSPLTLALFGAVVGYYVAYYSGVLAHSRARNTST